MRFVVGFKQDMFVKRAYVHKRRGIPIFEDPTYEANPYDRRAMEAALRLREKYGGEVVSITVGGYEKPELVAREALAMGADRAILVEGIDPTKAGVADVAKVFVGVLERIGEYDLILFGERSSDYSGSLFGQYVSGLLGLPLGYRVVSIEIGDGSVAVEEKLAKGVRALELSVPAVLVISGDAYKPRYPSTWSIADAFKRSEIEVYSVGDLGVAVRGELSLKPVRYVQPEAMKRVVKKVDPERAGRELLRIVGGE